jgi:tetratricopeptide (TPR) repeat protein
MLLIVTTAFASQDERKCAQRQDDQGIAACTRLISEGNLDQTDLATTYAMRGTAYLNRGKYDSAIADFTQVIQLLANNSSPELAASAYVTRGTTYLLKWNNALALADFRKALAINSNNEQAINGIKRMEVAIIAPSPSAETQAPLVAGPPPVVLIDVAPKRQEPSALTHDRKKSIIPRRRVGEKQPTPAHSVQRIALEPGILKAEPPPHTMHRNQVVLVDDRSCPGAMIKRIAATRFGRRSYCAPPR